LSNYLSREYDGFTMARSTLKIDIFRYISNLNTIKHSQPSVKLTAVVKANAYGLGLIPMAKAAVKAGADYLGVAHLSEGVALRDAGITTPITLLSEPINESFEQLIDYDVHPTIYQFKTLTMLAEALREKKRASPFPVHLKVDTGMSRLGCLPTDFVPLAEAITSNPLLHLASIFTHFANADMPDSDYTAHQYAVFQTCIQSLKDKGISIPLCHCANSGVIKHFPHMWMDMVRFGLGSYENVVTLSAPIMLIKPIPAGTSVSYGGDYQPTHDTYLATLPIGYADGIPRLYGLNGGQVLIRGKRYPIVGKVCMDMLMVDLGANGGEFQQGEEVVLIGEDDGESISVSEMGRLTVRSEYEVLCGIGNRVERVYHGE
jgi:alanine racemase